MGNAPFKNTLGKRFSKKSPNLPNAAIIESVEEVVDAMTEAYKTQEEIAQKRAEVEKELTDAMIVEANAQRLTLDEYKKKLCAYFKIYILSQ